MEERRGVRIAICVPSHDRVPAKFAYDLGRMMGYLGTIVGAEQGIEGVSLNFVTGTYVHSARQELAEAALSSGADYVLWIDSDMRFPKDALVRLLQRGESVVGINYAKRGLPPAFVAIKKVGRTAEDTPEWCVTDADSEGLEEVEAMGGGMVLMRSDVFHDLHDPYGEDGPWYWYEWLPEIGQQVGEDVYFCDLLREAGHTLYVDHDLSKECAHVGSFEFRTQHVEGITEADAAPEPDAPALELVED